MPPVSKSEFCAKSDGSEKWLADTGATTHISMSDTGMTNVTSVNVKVIVGDGSEVICTKRGDILTSDGTHKMLLKRVLYAPSFHKNIISVGQFMSNNSLRWVSSCLTTRIRLRWTHRHSQFIPSPTKANSPSIVKAPEFSTTSRGTGCHNLH